MSKLFSELKKQADELTITEKEQVLKKARIERSYDEHVLTNSKIAKAETIDLKKIPEGYLEQLDSQYLEYKNGLKDSLPFMTPNLTKLVPLYFPSLVLVGALTGSGKTTASANIVHGLLKEKKRVLIISNEELVLDVYTRIACLELDLNINDRIMFTDEQHDAVRKKIPEIFEYVRVIDSEYDSNSDLTSSVEGIKAIFEHICEEKNWDCIIVDYYQKVTKSQGVKDNAGFLVLQNLTNLLDKYYKICHAPVIVMCQLHPAKSDDISFEARVKLGKSILMSCTFALEMESDKSKYETKWICHKGRWGNQGARVVTDWSKGKFKDKGVPNE